MRRFLLLVSVLVPVLLLTAPFEARAFEQSTLDQYWTHLESLRALAESCEAKAVACDARAVGGDDQVALQGLGVGANANTFATNYGWLRDALNTARNADADDRSKAMHATGARLDEALREAGRTSADQGLAQANIATARRKTDAILGHEEFATVREDSIWERLLARVALWLESFFNHVAQFGERSPWIGPVMEWSLIGIALVGLAVWAMRVLQRQRLAVRVEAERQIEPWEEAARNWRALAEEQAARGNWREAVHCLYWASIAVLEGRRFWTPNRSRTPREYVRLLEAGSQRWRLLRQQTQGFEHVWYGLHDAAQQDYDRARELHEGLRTA